LKRIISTIYLKIIGWTIVGSMPQGLKKAVIISAPHTSMWDFVIGRAAFYSKGVKHIHFLIKKEMFRFPIGVVIRWLGAIAIDRGKNNNTIQVASRMFEQREHFFLLLTPEGTRAYNEHWKKGFYQIAVNAKVPIVLTFINYGKKEGGFGPVLYPSGNYDEDFKLIRDFYHDKTAKYPENFNLSPQYRMNKDE
jgi:1-acyl-sn-glycerol-3-phosphate acyltransferase